MNNELEKCLDDVCIVTRSAYQLEAFVIGQHDTPPMKWRQILIEAQDLLYKIRSAELQLEKTAIEIHRLLSTGDPIDAIDAEQKELDSKLTRNALSGAKMELKWLTEIAEKIGFHSLEEIEADQPNYWNRRLNRQADLDRLSTIQQVSSGNLASMLQAGLLTYTEEPCAIQPGN